MLAACALAWVRLDAKRWIMPPKPTSTRTSVLPIPITPYLGTLPPPPHVLGRLTNYFASLNQLSIEPRPVCGIVFPSSVSRDHLPADRPRLFDLGGSPLAPPTFCFSPIHTFPRNIAQGRPLVHYPYLPRLDRPIISALPAISKTRRRGTVGFIATARRSPGYEDEWTAGLAGASAQTLPGGEHRGEGG